MIFYKYISFVEKHSNNIDLISLADFWLAH